MKLRDKVVLITGSSRGIGEAIARLFAQEGADVIINCSTSKSEAEKTLIGLPKDKWQKHALIKADVKDPAEVSAMMSKIKGLYGHLDILINNAGTTRFIEHKNLDRLTPEIFDLIYKTNLRGAFLCVQKALPLLKKSKEAQIINIASIAAITAVGSNIAYCAMKAATVNMTKSLARAFAPKIRVNAVSPGLTETELIKGWSAYRKEQIRRTPLKRLASAEDIAESVLALAVSLKYVTGHNLVVDGGRTLE